MCVYVYSIYYIDTILNRMGSYAMIYIKTEMSSSHFCGAQYHPNIW